MFNLTETNKGTIVDTLQKKWSSSYDIVVRPKGSTMETESENLLEPNYLNGINGGITTNQYEQIKKMDNIEVAAPISIVGYAMLGVVLEEKLNFKEPGIYRVREEIITDTGLTKEKSYNTSFYTVRGNEQPLSPAHGLHSQYQGELAPKDFNLLVAIDPEQEAKLVGLNNSILTSDQSRYFNSEDTARIVPETNGFHIPVLINTQSFNRGYHKYTVEKLSVPFQSKEERKTTLEKIAQEGGKKYLESLKTEEISLTKKIESKDIEDLFFDQLAGSNNTELKGKATEGSMLLFQSGNLKYSKVDSPFPERWNSGFQVEPSNMVIEENNPNLKELLPSEGFRDVDVIEQEFNTPDGPLKMNPFVNYKYVGFYDPNKITVSKDPLNELPLETYRPSRASLVLDENGKPVNPSKEVSTAGNPAGLLTNPPNILTTMDAAAMIHGEDAISSIRIKVKGVETLGEKSEEKLQNVRKQIESQTGLVATITRGSSPQPVITKVTDDSKVLGWIEQPWIHLGASITIFKETTMGYSGIILSMVAVAIVYVLANSYVSLLARRKEFAILLSLGWQTKDLIRIVTIESVMMATFVSLVAIVVETFFTVNYGEPFNVLSILSISFFSFVIYLTGAAWSSYTIAKIKPYEAIKSGEHSKIFKSQIHVNNRLMLVVKEIFSKWKRNLLSIFSIALPVGLLTFFIFITYQLNGVLYTSWLGQFVAMEVDKTHYLTLIIGLLISILTTGEIMWQNISDRKQEIAVLKAVGWSNQSVRYLVVLEGLFIGLLAGVIGLVITLTTIYLMYHIFPIDQFYIFVATLSVPVLVGTLASVIPAEIASKINPYEELKKAS
ncbi:ABC transporter permease [Fictibacillus nanhaiensis]|uniref:ABC transporter permease n=1 Tax=Fictibacillus nanhaiensis TaxID=742169 RepID=A0ABS2ZNE8_9BACL|nr:ABC transporter permease [Fictibacillus nanhaiensis]